jgi:hypothetical protein
MSVMMMLIIIKDKYLKSADGAFEIISPLSV